MLDDLPTPDGMNDGDRLFVKAVVSVVCTTVECLCKKPIDLYPVWKQLQDCIDNTMWACFDHSELPAARFLWKLNANVYCVKIQCLLNRPYDPQKARGLLHSWVEATPNLTPSERSDMLVFADFVSDGMEVGLASPTRGGHLLADPTLHLRFQSQELRECMRKLCGSYEVTRNLNKLRDLKHGLRKRGICVYTHHST